MILDGKTIFLVEDDPVNLAVIRVSLQTQGALVPYDHWGDATLKKMLYSVGNIDLILLDIMLPGKISGYDIFDVIKKNPEFANTPIVAVTASDPDLEIPKAREKGFNGYISKPIDRNQFPQDLLTVIEGGEVWPE